MRAWAVLAAIGVALGAGACTRVNPDYCSRPGPCGDGRVCDIDYNVCRLPDGGPGDAAPEAGADAAIDAPPECRPATQAADCTADAQKPICVDGRCAGCTEDAQCLARDPAHPACASGACVQCTTALHCAGSADGPICDTTARACGPCARDEQCAAASYAPGVCVGGGCPDADGVLWVAGGATGCTDSGTGAQAAPFCSIGAAASYAKSTAGAPPVVVVAPAAMPYPSFEVKGSLVVVGAAGGDEVVVNGDASHPAASLAASGGTVTLRRLHLHGGTPAVVSCTATTCTLEQLAIEGGTVGVQATSAPLVTVRRSQIWGNPGGGISTLASDFEVVNNFIYLNGLYTSAIGAASFFQTSSDATKRFVNNTVWLNLGQGAAVACQSMTAATVLNGIVWQNTHTGGAVSSVAGCDVSHTLTDDPAVAGLGDNPASTPPPLFVSTTAPAFDLHLQAGSGGLGIGGPGAPADDIDGEPRPAGRIDLGADQITP
ncbi:MAG TPA: right-handed parallel beta-helix repeat-containing protein [Polyangia bacterium]